jgi:hypothetical protein
MSAASYTIIQEYRTWFYKDAFLRLREGEFAHHINCRLQCCLRVILDLVAIQRRDILCESPCNFVIVGLPFRITFRELMQ